MGGAVLLGKLGLGFSALAALFTRLSLPSVSAAATHASYKRMPDEEEFKARRPEGHDYWAATSDSQ